MRLKGFTLKVRQFYVNARPFPVILVCQTQRFKPFLNSHFNCYDLTIYIFAFTEPLDLIEFCRTYKQKKQNVHFKKDDDFIILFCSMECYKFVSDIFMRFK